YAWAMLRGDRTAYNRRGLLLGMLVGGLTIVPQIWWGHHLAQFVAESQPVKLAAMEGQFATERGAPLRLGGIPDPVARTTRWAIEIPGGLSWLSFDDPNAEVKGLDAFPRDEQPNPVLVHIPFQIMVGAGSFLLAAAAAYAVALWRGGERHPLLLWMLLASGPAAFLATEAGWFVTEFGRQPWIIQGVMRVGAGVSNVPGLVASLIAYTAIYLFLLAALVWLLLRLAHHGPAERRAVEEASHAA
ncbi:MAG: cytochrome ubiquinol oxidase subunit I, partial [Chloroflexi bacterium]|nr:cytochrome ubiquinol oxidase subunit I [Chloroflexota bacterium]